MLDLHSCSLCGVDRLTHKQDTILALVREAAAAAPEATALLGEQAMTYAELMRSVMAVATQLTAIGVGPGDIVGLAAGRSQRAVVLALGIMRAGAVYLPLDPLYPDPSLAHMIRSASVRTIIVDHDSRGRLAVEADVVIDAAALLEMAAAGMSPAEPAPCGAAYAMFTSGSTGMPKGVLLGHAGLAQYAYALLARLGLRGDDRCLGLSPLGFSSSIRQLLLPLTQGATVVVPDERQALLPWGVIDLVRVHQVTHLDLTPSYWRAVIDTMPPGEVRTALTSLRRLVFASEPLDGELVRRTRDLAPDAQVWNMYGCTETTGIIAAYRVTEEESPDTAVPIGAALDHVSIEVQASAAAIPGVASGEMVVTGSAVALGYLNGAAGELRQWWRAGGGCASRPYTSGDQVRVRDGVLVWNGRVDRMLKVRGMRVSPELVEDHLLAYPGIQHAAVVGATEQGLWCVVEAATEAPLPERPPLVAWLRIRLPEHMVPAAVSVIDSWPVLPNGKTDYQALVEHYGPPSRSS